MNKSRIVNHFVCILLGTFLVLDVSAQPRVIENLNREWKYKIGDHPGAEMEGYADEEWEMIGLPHSFSIPYFMSKDFYIGYGWYRKTIRLNKKDLDKKLSVEFDGVFQETELYVNGQLAGHHQGGYTAFSIDITPYVKEGENLLAVRVNNLWQPTIAPRGGEHVFSGGIYRNVRLVKKEKIYLQWCGTCVTTPTLEETNGKSSVVHVKSCIVNESGDDGEVRLEVVFRDINGKIISRTSEKYFSQVGEKKSVEIVTDEVKNPLLWSTTNPNLYTLDVRLFQGRRLMDEESYNVGFRWFRWSKNEGFFLNGERLFFHGANVHQDQAGWGDAVTDEAARRDVRMIKDAGFDMIRGSHYPHSSAFVDECDRQGILFWSEAPFWGTAGPKDDGYWTASAYPVNPRDTAAFEQSALRQLEEMILLQRNHPSVFVWSMSNEPFFTDAQTLPGVHRLLRRMVEATHKLDPTRPAAIGGSQRPLGNERIDLIGDIAGYNGDGANIADFQQPAVPSVVSEYGSTTSERPGRYFPGWGDLNRDEGWRGRPWRGGQAIWCGFDHGSIFGDNLGKMGIVDYFRLPKRAWYWYRNEYKQIPPPEWPIEGVPTSVRLTSSKAKGIRADGTDDVQLIVTIVDANGRELSNSPSVTLRIVSGPGEFPTGRSITFSSDSDIRIMDGKAAITLRSYYAGRTVVEATSEGLQSSSVELGFVGAPKYKTGISSQTIHRPYVKYVKESNALQTYGVNSPTFVSSSAEGHSSGLATDGDLSTYWTPMDSDSHPQLVLDTERGLLLSGIHLVFVERVSSIVIETSSDNEHWMKIADVEQKQQVDISLEVSRPARFVRLSFPVNTKPKLLDLKVKGYIQ